MRVIKYFLTITLCSGTLLLSGCFSMPPEAVWISEEPHIVVYQRNLYSSLFNSRAMYLAYLIEDDGSKTRLFVSFWKDRSMTFLTEPRSNEHFLRGYWQRVGRQLELDIDGEIITFSRLRRYEAPNIFEWFPGLENMKSIWETQDGTLRLDFVNIVVRRPRGSLVLSYPFYQGTYFGGRAEISLTIQGDAGEMEYGVFRITIREDFALPGHTSPVDGGRELTANGTIDGNEIHLVITSIQGEWHFSDGITLYQVSD